MPFDNLNANHWAIIQTFCFIFLLFILRGLILRAVGKKVQSAGARQYWREGVNYVVLIIAVLTIVRIWFSWFQSIITFLSVATAAIVIVNKEFILNLTAYPMIIWRSLFTLGHRVQVGVFKGDVISIGLFYFDLAEVDGQDTPTGRVLKVPNSQVLTNVVVNAHRGGKLVWKNVTFETPWGQDWKRARDIAMTVLDQVSFKMNEDVMHGLRKKGEEIMFEEDAPQVMVSLAEKKVVLRCRYLCKVGEQYATERDFWDKLLPLLSEENLLSVPKET